MPKHASKAPKVSGMAFLAYPTTKYQIYDHFNIMMWVSGGAFEFGAWHLAAETPEIEFSTWAQKGLFFSHGTHFLNSYIG